MPLATPATMRTLSSSVRAGLLNWCVLTPFSPWIHLVSVLPSMNSKTIQQRWGGHITQPRKGTMLGCLRGAQGRAVAPAAGGTLLQVAQVGALPDRAEDADLPDKGERLVPADRSYRLDRDVRPAPPATVCLAERPLRSREDRDHKRELLAGYKGAARGCLALPSGPTILTSSGCIRKPDLRACAMQASHSSFLPQKLPQVVVRCSGDEKGEGNGDNWLGPGLGRARGDMDAVCLASTTCGPTQMIGCDAVQAAQTLSRKPCL